MRTRTITNGYHRSRRPSALVHATFALLLATGAADGQWPEGLPFVVNADTAGYERYPDVARDALGRFVVVWQEPVPGDYSSRLIRARQFDSNGGPLGTELQVNSYTTGFRNVPAVALEADGDFVVVWEGPSYGGTDTDVSIQGRRFSSSGAPLGADFQVNVVTTDHQHVPDVAITGSGGFVVVWTDDSVGGDFERLVVGRRFGSDGTPEPAEFVISTNPDLDDRLPQVAGNASGDFIVAWEEHSDALKARRFTSAGIGGPTLTLTERTSSTGVFPALDLHDDGRFVASWTQFTAEGTGTVEVAARLFTSNGTPLTGELVVAATSSAFSAYSSVALFDDASFVVSWSESSYGGPLPVLARVFASSGGALSPRLDVGGPGGRPAVAGARPGNFVVVWQGSDIEGQRFSDLVFADDFESGDLSRWKLAVGGAHLAVTPGAALVGSLGLAVDVSNSGTVPDMRYVVDDKPDALDRYRARFYLDPNGYTPGSPGERIKLFQLLSEVPDQRRLVTIVLRATGGGYELRAKVRADDGTVHNSGGFAIADAPHFVEIAWQQATAPGFDDGYLKLSLDGVEKASVAGVDNDLRAAERDRLGALGLKPGTSGTIYLDAFESRRLAPIGAAP